MKFLLDRQIDRDFAGGIYLTPLGEIPRLGTIEPLAYEGDLYLPLDVGESRLETVVESGQRVGRRHSGERRGVENHGHAGGNSQSHHFCHVRADQQPAY